MRFEGSEILGVWDFRVYWRARPGSRPQDGRPQDFGAWLLDFCNLLGFRLLIFYGF